MLENKELDGTETAVSGGRTPLDIADGTKVRVALRGMGMYEGGFKKDFVKDVVTEDKIKNAALIVCSPDDVEEEYVMSSPVDSVMGKSILAFGERDGEGVFWLKEENKNVVGWVGVKESDPKEGREHGYKQLFFDHEVDKKGKNVVMKGDLEPALVGAEQRTTVDSSPEGEVVL